MARTLSPERQLLKEWAICLKGCGVPLEKISLNLNLPLRTIYHYLDGLNVAKDTFIMAKNGDICHNSGHVCKNFKDGLPPNPKPQLFVGKAEDMHFLENESVDIIITSPPYNLGQEKWPMGGNGRTPRESGVGYSDHGDNMTEHEYREWQIQCLNEMYRVAKRGASLFYNHKVRQREGEILHPILWLQNTTKWIIRQEIIWDRKSTHNHSATLFWPQDERIYWLTKGKPNLADKSVNVPSVWRQFGPKPNSGHPAPFTPELPKMLLKAIGKPGDTILDPFGGSMTTCLVASAMGYKSIGVDISQDYVEKAKTQFGVDNG